MSGEKSIGGQYSSRFVITGLLLLACLFVLQARFRLVLVVGESMQPTLKHGDLLLVSKRTYQQVDPLRGDIVVAWRHRELIVKRVVGLPGEVVEIIDGALYVNEQVVIESHPIEGTSLNIGRGNLATGRYALLGDNRGLPEQETVSAILSKHDMLGKVVCRIPTGRKKVDDARGISEAGSVAKHSG